MMNRKYAVINAHEEDIKALAWSPDGKWLVSCSSDDAARLWDATTGKEGDIVYANIDPINCLAWSPDSKFLAFGSAYNCLHVWALVEAELAWSVHVQYKRVFYDEPSFLLLAWSPKKSLIASANADETIRTWDANNGKSDLLFDGLVAKIIGLAWFPDGEVVVAADVFGQVKAWNAINGRPVFTLQRRMENFAEIAFSHDCQRIAVAECTRYSGKKNHLRVLDLINRAESVNFQRIANGEQVQKIQWSLDSSRIAVTSSSEQTLYVLDTKDGRLSLEFTYCKGLSESFCWSPDGRQIAFSAPHGEIVIIAVCRWSDRTHHLFSADLKRVVFQLMCVRNRIAEYRLFPSLPMQIWLLLCEFMSFC